jgi:hypothetical protein
MDSTQAGDTQPAAADTLRPLLAPGLAPLFWRAERLGTSSAWWQHVPFAHWLVAEGRPRLLVELGSHGGVSYAAFCNAVRRTGLDTRCFAVDTWQGDEHAGHYDETVFADLSRYHDAAFSDFSQMLRCTFDTARERFAPGSIDLLHIDGLHTYDAVRHDFESWLPLLSDRAVVLFHDTTERQADFGVWRLWAELAQRYPAFEFAHGHGLGVLCVGADAPEAVRTLCALPEAEAAVLRQRMALLGARWDEDSLRLQAGTELGWLRAQMTHLAGAHEKAARLDRETAEQKAALTRARAEAARLAEGIRGARAAVREARARSEAEARQAVEASTRRRLRTNGWPSWPPPSPRWNVRCTSSRRPARTSTKAASGRRRRWPRHGRRPGPGWLKRSAKHRRPSRHATWCWLLPPGAPRHRCAMPPPCCRGRYAGTGGGP